MDVITFFEVNITVVIFSLYIKNT